MSPEYLIHPSLNRRSRGGEIQTETSGFVIAILWLAVFIPGHLLAWRVELGFTAVMVCVSVLLLDRRGFPRAFGTLPISDIVWPILIITATSASAYALRRYMNPGASGLRDYLEMLRFVVLLSVMVLIEVDFSRRAIRALDTVIIASLTWMGIVFAAYTTSIPFLTPFLTGALYGTSKTNVELSIAQIRVSAPFENPNFLAFYLVLSLTYLLFFSRHCLRYWIAPVAAVGGFLTGSRSGWIAMLIVLTLFGIDLLSRALRWRDLRLIGAAVALVLVAVGAWSILSDGILGSYRVATTVDYLKAGRILEEPNLAARIQVNGRAMELFLESPVVGTGSAKYTEIDVVDNQYMTWLVRTGLIGFVMLLLVYARVAVAQLDAAWRSNQVVGVAAFWLSAAVMLITGSFLDNFRLTFIFWYFAFAIWATILASEHLDLGRQSRGGQPRR